MEKPISSSARQIVTSSSIGLVMSGQMSVWVYAAAALPQMEHSNSTINFTPDEASWFATVPLMMTIPGSAVGATICEMVGPRRLYLILLPLFWFSYTAMALASWKVIQDAGAAKMILLMSRVIQGSVVSLLFPTTSIYVYEVNRHRWRGTMTSILEIWGTWGFLLCYITGCFMSWSTIAWFVPLITIVPGSVGVVLSPESPLWLARKGKEEEARKILYRYRCNLQEVAEDLKATCKNQGQKAQSLSELLRVMAKKPNVLAMIASSVNTIMKELVGFAVINIYIVHIFDAAGVGLDPRYSSVIVGVVRLAANTIASLLLHHFRRRVLLLCGNTLAGTAAFFIGLFFYLKSSNYDVSWLGWLPVTGLAVHMLGCAAAIGPTTWLMAVEVLPGPVRSVGFGIASTNFAIAAFVMSKTFVSVLSYIGMHGVFWFFTAGAIVFNILTIVFLPETFGKSLQDIEDYWNKSSKVKEKIPVSDNSDTGDLDTASFLSHSNNA
ncbi:facilitated trehalose transporter Tret1-like [Macrobrachium rosenbergii]|uniref:facilitated trehalose transporter Tret1-like n=1 Tax=Macrobrachium rosenbergii TaxID=79674 RepID=UPI0034D4ADD6